MSSRLISSLTQCSVIREITEGYRQVANSLQELGEAARQTWTLLSGSLVRMVFVALSMALMPVAANANGNMVDSFTYNGTQVGFTNGSVYSVSIAGTALNVCLFTPVAGTSAPSLEYTPSCQNTLASNPNSVTYTSVAYLGTANNPSNYFAVGDANGNIHLMYINFVSNDPNPISLVQAYTYTFNDVDDSSSPCGQITSLAVDPQGQDLYISCVGTTNDISWIENYDARYGYTVGAVLGVAPINGINGLGAINAVPPFLTSVSTNYWNNLSLGLYTQSNVTAAVFPGVSASNLSSVINPKLRVYPPGYPALANTPYSSTGGVFYSGIVGGFSNGYPINSGLICSAGTCEVAYNITLSQDDYGAVFTAAEYGTDVSGNGVLYWNQVEVLVAPAFGTELSAMLEVYTQTNNLVVTCQLSSLISSTITSTPCSSQSNLQWPPANVPSSTVWLDQLIFSPTPASVASNTSYVDGLLQISTWNNGYLAYYDVASGSNVPGVFMSNNGSNGEVGANVQGLTTDSNGNLLIQAGSSGLLGFNAFPTSSINIETQSDVTYVPIPADSTPSGTCGTLGCKVQQGLGIASFIVSIIALAELDDDTLPNQTQFALRAPVTKGTFQTAERPEQFSLSEPDTLGSDASGFDDSFKIAMNFGSGMSGNVLGSTQSDSEPSLLELAEFSAEAQSGEVQCCDSNGNAPNPALANFLGAKPYWGTFTYTEQQLALMGIRPGDRIRGMQLRLAEGISAQPKERLRFRTVQIALKSGAAAASDQAAWNYGSTVFRRPLNVLRCSYNRSVRNGYGPIIGFTRPYRYLGGDLTLTLRHSGRANSKRFYLDAFEGAGVIGAYAQLSSVWSQPTNVTELKVAPQVKFIKKGSVPGGVKRPYRCN